MIDDVTMRSSLGTTDVREGAYQSVQKKGIAAIIGLFVALCLTFNVVNPTFEAPDELWHFLNIKFIAENKSLIVQSDDPLANPARQEGGQPPLYYIFSAGLVSWIPLGQTMDVATLNADGQPGKLNATLNKNVVIHSDNEGFPYQGVSLAVHILRLFSTVLSLGTIIATFAIAREIFPNSRALPLAAAALTAFLPQFAFLSASVNNDNLATFLATLVLLLLVKLSKGDLRDRNFLALGILIGLVSITKMSALGLLPFSLAVVLILARYRRSSNVAVKGVSSVIAGFAFIGGWWYVRNWYLYGDPLGVRAFLRSIDRPDARFGFDGLIDHASTLLGSFLALFGWSNVPVHSHFYWFLGAVFAVGLLSAIWRYIRMLVIREKTTALPDNTGPQAAVFILLGWLALLIGQLLLWGSATGYDVGRLVFPSIASISTLTVLGIANVAGRRMRPLLITGILLVMFCVTALSPVIYIRPAYKYGTQFVSEERSLARPLNVTFGDQMKLLSYEVSREAVATGDSVAVTLYWQALSGIRDDTYRTALVLTSSDRSKGLYPVHGLLSEPNITRRLKSTGWLLRQHYELKVPREASGSSRLPIVVGVDGPDGAPLAAYDGAMRPIGDSVLMFELKLSDGSD